MDLSIIIPIYNCEKYLERCLNSIVPQLSEGVEMILVDDGSEDRSSQICNEYAMKNQFIQVVHQKNKGEGGARNRGLALATGEWIAFVDADDYVTDDFVSQIFRNMEPEVDILMFEKITVEREVKSHIEKIGKIQYYDEASHDIFTKKCFMGHFIIKGYNITSRDVLSKAYRRSLLRESNIVFEEGIEIGADMLFSLRIYQCFHRAKCIGKGIYCYVTNSDSITNRYKPNYREIVQAYIKSIESWLKLCPEYNVYHATYRLNDIILFMKYDFFHKQNHESRNSLWERMREILLNGRYKLDYKLAKESDILKDFYGPGKRIVFWMALHGQFNLLKWIAHIYWR